MFDAALLGDARHLVGEGPPSELGLDAEEEDDVASRGGRHEGFVGRPRVRLVCPSTRRTWGRVAWKS